MLVGRRLLAAVALASVMVPGNADASVRDASIHVPTLRQGDRGGEVAAWQAAVDRMWRDGPSHPSAAERRFVRRHGLLAIDGVFGPLTSEATKLYQRDLGFPATGVVDFRDWERSMVLGDCCDGSPPVVLRSGDASTFVTWLQVGLDRWMAATRTPPQLLIPDGAFGPLTLRATLAYQERAGLTPDGVVGPLTWDSLGSHRLLNLP